MTLPAFSDGRNPANPHAALRLHNARRMRFTVALALVAAVVLGLGAAARAQSTPSTTVTPTTCTGLLAGDPIGLAFPDSNGNLQSVATQWVPFVFNRAECECATTDVVLQLQLKPMALPLGTNAVNQLWLGNSCDNYSTRTLNTVCQQQMTNDIGPTSFNNGAPTDANGFVDIHIPARPLTTIGQTGAACSQTQVQNDIFVYSITSGNPSSPDAECHLALTEQLQGSAPAQNLSAQSGDSAVTVNWSAPAVSSLQPYWYQILCADSCGNPVAGHGGTLGYSVCLNGQLFRRPLPTASSLGTTTTDDGGVTPTDLLAAASLPNSGLGTEATGADGGNSDAGSCGAVSMDMGFTDGGTPVFPFGTLDPKFLCGNVIMQQGTGNYSSRITGLTNGQTYFFAVVAIDQWGNPNLSEVVQGTAAPTEDLYRRYWDEGGRAHGFCFIATAAFGSYEDRYVKVLRQFRDEVLLPTESGREFVDWYYANSPPVADFIARHKSARIGTQLALWPIIGAAAFWLYTSTWLKLLLLVGVVALVLRRRRIRRARQLA